MNLAVLLTIIISIIAVAIFIGVGFLVRETRSEDDEEKLWKDSYEKADKFIEKLTLKEKISLLYGTENMKEITPITPEPPFATKDDQKRYLCVGKLDSFTSESNQYFSGMCLQDGPAGVRFSLKTSISWQASLNTAATFNKNLFREIGKAQGAENYAKGIHVMLGPCVGMMRCPGGGRGWEGYGEDPYLSGIAAAEVIKGIQSQNVIASLKHFVTNDQETYRKASSSNVGMAALMDVYVEPFYRAVRDAHVGSVMSSYNAINNTYVYESKLLLTHILREILGFQGFVVSDWWEVVSNTTATIEAGLDMNMPGGYDEGPYGGDLYKHYGRENSYWAPFEAYVRNGILDEEVITRAATRIIATMYQLNQKPDEKDGYPSIDLYKYTITEERKALQRQAATESQVLLKNNDTLPIDVTALKTKNKKVAIIGSDAKNRDACAGEGDFNCITSNGEVYDGHIPLGYGSGTTTFNYLVDPKSAIEARLNEEKIGHEASVDLSITNTRTNDDGTTYKLSGIENINAATALFDNDDFGYAIIFLSAVSGEEYISLEGTIGDRNNLDVFHQGNELVDAIVEKRKKLMAQNKDYFKIIVVINAPGAVNVPWRDNVDAIIYSGFPGSESGNAVVAVLFGDENPSGHLPFTWAEMEQYGASITELENLNSINSNGDTWKSVYRYNGVDSDGRRDYKAGHSRLQIEYEDGLYIGQRWFNKMNKKPIYPFGYGLSYTTFEYSGLDLEMKKEGLEATFKIKNTGSVKGKAVPMMFLTFPESIGEYPKYILKGFEKVEIAAGETATVKVVADAHALSYFNVELDNYIRVCKDEIKVYIAENGDPDQHKLDGEVKANHC